MGGASALFAKSKSPTSAACLLQMTRPELVPPVRASLQVYSNRGNHVALDGVASRLSPDCSCSAFYPRWSWLPLLTSSQRVRRGLNTESDACARHARNRSVRFEDDSGLPTVSWNPSKSQIESSSTAGTLKLTDGQTERNVSLTAAELIDPGTVDWNIRSKTFGAIGLGVSGITTRVIQLGAKLNF